jgi:hypothetical protein
MLPTVPVPVWEQIPIVIVFSFLMAGLGWVLVRLAEKAFAGANAAYAEQLRASNEQWQRYCDARTEGFFVISKQMLDRMDEVALVLQRLVDASAAPRVTLSHRNAKLENRVGV